MTGSKVVSYAEIGRVRYLPSIRARRVRIQVKADQGVTVVVPPGVTFDQAEGFLLAKKEWVRKAVGKYAGLLAQQTVFRPGLEFAIRNYRLRMVTLKGGLLRNWLEKDELVVAFPEGVPAEDPRVQDFTRRAVERLLRLEAITYLPDRTAELAGKHQLTFAKVSVRNNRTRWGSCSSNGNISLNIHLMRLPDALIDYIILHELVHTIHRNHGPGFHNQLELVYPGHRAAEKMIRNYSPGVF
jgi:predicted metal-dependent hydrolase